MKNKPSIEQINLLQNQINSWRALKTEEKSSYKIYSEDRKSLRKILSLYKKGKWEEAGNSARKLDTILREMIPELMWIQIQNADT